jgi:solute carrier family 35, member E3
MSWFELLCILLNLTSACGIVFANKAVFSVYGFRFAATLTCIHTVFSLAVAKVFCAMGVFAPKSLPKRATIALASAFAGYVVLCNMSLSMNTVGFYQLLKIAGAPTMMFMESFRQRQLPKFNVAVCVFVTCLGIGLATITDTRVTTNMPGMLVGIASVLVTAQYGIWIGSMRTQHNVSSMQLLDQYLPYATVLMLMCVPLFDLKGVHDTTQQRTGLLHYQFSIGAVCMIAVSAILGVAVSFSTFFIIGFTSPLTYAVVGHAKTIAILAGGVFIFRDEVTWAKGLGLTIALSGVMAYTICAQRTNLDAQVCKDVKRPPA